MKASKNIVVVGDLISFPSLVMECFGTLSCLANTRTMGICLMLADGPRSDNMHVHEPGGDSSGRRRQQLYSVDGYSKTTNELVDFSKRVSHLIGASVSPILDFDFHSPSQANVGLLKPTIDSIHPSFVLMPYLKCRNNLRQQILAQSSLIACRGVQNLLMYDSEQAKSFSPTLISDLSEKDMEMKNLCMDMLSSFGWPQLQGYLRKSQLSNIAKTSNHLIGASAVLIQNEGPPSKGAAKNSIIAAKSHEGFAIHRLVFS